ncbi:MAG: glycerophosphodiester phosphodiesterase [Syntrophales bacterium LBB04]|nr:glycerophosphodiester phosphodiesterase [Syntrophales bacterium LBB04]
MACAHLNNVPEAGAALRGRYPIIVTAHRGFSGQAPENTMAAFRRAIDVGCEMIELDVHLTRDGEVAVIHDDDLERTTNGRGAVAAKTLAELRELDAGSWFHPRFSGERIPLLAEVLAITRDRISINIELKRGKHLPYTMEELADRTLSVVETAGMADQVLFSSFDPAAVDRIRERNPILLVALIVETSWTKPEEAGGGRIYPVLSCRTTTLNEENIRRAHAEGIRVHVWTVNTRREMERFIALGVDGIITNHPNRLIALLQGAPKT